MDSKSELLVFNRKELVIIIVLLVLVAMFSFTLGLKLGKSLGVAKETHEEHAPLAAQGHEEHPAEAPAVAEPGHDAGAHPTEHAEHHTDATAQKEAVKPEDDVQDKQAENLADKELVEEAQKQKVALAKPVPMALPKEKKSESHETGRYTLQVGSHRTVAEAAEQVTELKRRNLDAFYLEAKVPGKGTWYRVAIGSFASKDIAERTASQWKQSKSLPPYIVQKINE